MKKAVKPTLYLNGKLLCPLALGRAAIFSVGDQIYHTSAVVRIHAVNSNEVHFETQHTHYYLNTRPFVAAVRRAPIPVMAACA